MTRLACVLSLALLPFVAVAESQELSHNLSGWKILSGNWTATEGVITGKAFGDQPAWLLREGDLNDFELDLEFRTPEAANGGVAFRCHGLPVTPHPKEEDAVSAPRQMYGYLANIETRQRAATGRILDMHGAGGLSETAEAAAAKLSQTEWNPMRIVARGSTIEVYLHGELAGSVEDEAFIGGGIALQVAGPEGTAVEFRNVKLNDLGRLGEWRPIFNGKDLEGWDQWGQEEWLVEDGAIVGRSGPKKSEGYLATKEIFSKVRVRGQVKMLGEGNFGLFYHSTVTYKDDGYPVISGVQGEVQPEWPGATGWIYESYKRGWLVEPDPTTLGAMALRPGQWNAYEIRVDGPRATTWVNGIRVLDYTDPAPNLHEGALALQLHTGGVDGILWKDLMVQMD
ncbi:MAG: DUF1080 domain-containing protein [Candidatus Hydrogenedentes bacterium]|nr:DUF1080 domain-containing protein [Candidatus Hydrogenedentota bacterium]